MIRFLKRLRFYLKKLFGSKVLKTAIEQGGKAWLEVNEEFGGPLTKEGHLTKAGNWKKGHKEKYELEKKKRQEMWLDITRAVLTAAFPQYKGITSILFLVLGYLGMQDKL